MSEVRYDRTELRSRLLRRLVWKVPLIVLLVSFAVWWEWRKESEQQQPNTGASAAAAAALTGSWSGDVTYSWSEKFEEEFFFQPENGKLFGNASFLGVKRSIEDGKIDGDSIVFFVRFQESSGGTTSERKNSYSGQLLGDKIQMRLQDNRGNPQVEFVLNKRAAASR